MMKKPTFFTLTALWSMLLLFHFTSCKQKNEEIIPSSEFASYINAYTGGVISQASTIKIEFSAELPMVELHTQLKKNPFNFSPSLKGKAWWVNNKTLEFVPEEGALRPGKLYQATFNLGEFLEVDKELEKFNFTFRVMDRNFAVDLEAPRIPTDDPSKVTVNGTIRFSDTVDPATVEKMFSFSGVDGDTPSFILTPGESPDRYQFTIGEISRKANDETLTIKVNGKPFKTDYHVSKRVVIPAKGKFYYLSAERISTPEEGLRVTFSDPVSTEQDLRGLIYLEGVREYTQQVTDNSVEFYFDPMRINSYSLYIEAGMRNYNGKLLGESKSLSFSENVSKPEVRMTSAGTILPDSKNLLIPFSAVSLRAVDLTVVRIFENNVLMFLQDNSLSSSSELRRSGRMVYKKTLRLDQDPTKDLMEWNEFSIDLSGLIEQEPGAIYRIMLSFNQDYSIYPCGGKENADSHLSDANDRLTRLLPEEEVDYDNSLWDTPSTYYYMENEGYDWQIYDWQQRDNPCHPTYYMTSDRKVSRNVLATNMGLIVKKNQGGRLWMAVTDLLTAQPLSQVDITIYNFQLQPIGQAKTDSEGFAIIDTKGVPFVAVASQNRQKTYLKLVDGEDLSLSRFDTGGKNIEKGLKGFIYGERGVWRPGDTLHVTFILEDRARRIPESHPVSIELYTPQGQFYTRQIAPKGVNGFYTYKIPTRVDDPTGTWNSYVKVGGTSFHKALRIETVKPNRLKIQLKLPEILEAGDRQKSVTISSSWLTGATASNLKTDMELSLHKMNTQFSGYGNYTFNDPASNFESSKEQVFKGTLDQKGNVSVNLELPPASNAPGMLRADLTTRVYEPGGDASIQTTTVPYSPFKAYVGVNLNQHQGKYLETDKDYTFDIVTLNSQGKPIDRQNLQYYVYKIRWSWWWENRTESYKSYINNSSVDPVAYGRINTTQGKGSFSFRVDYPAWGRYLIYVKDSGGHAAGGTVVIDWPDWRGRSDKSDPSGLTMLSFSTDKEKYEAGETATVYIPAAAGGRALVSIETSTTVYKQEWIKVSSKEDTKYQFRIEPDMAPNIYLNIMLLQPHGQTTNDLPIRMYGVIPVLVDNPQSRLEPQITMPDVLRPEQPFNITVSEKNGQSMTYTLAIVDDGLLDLTSFRTPDPWSAFYAREALGIRTWDMFHQVVGAYSGRYGSLFGVGGDEMLKNQDTKANRFRPVVKFIGPFTLKKGGKDKHTIILPMYVGSVRTMVVAGIDGAYGNAEKTTPVRTPLMVLSTLPRVLSIGEEIMLPVNVFAMEKDIKQVSVTVETSSNLTLTDGNRQSLTFSEPGDELVMFRLKAGQATGVAKVKITATGNGQTATEAIEIEIRNPNPAVTMNESRMMEAGSRAEMSYELSTVSGQESWARLEISRIPSIDITRRFDFLYNYEHHCSEQLTSKVLPLLFIDQFKEISKEEKEMIKANVTEALRQLYGRQLPDGGFVYWPGDAVANEWITSYVGNLLIAAQEKGYEVNSQVLAKWKNFQKRAAQNWTYTVSGSLPYYGWDMQQAYRLYTLALAGSSELGAMNRMKEIENLSDDARWRLAAAYALIGKKDIGNELIQRMSPREDTYRYSYRIYGSYERDAAMVLETLLLLGRDREAFEKAVELAQRLSRENYFSTQSTAFALMAMGKLAGKVSGSIRMAWTLNDKKQDDIRTKEAVKEISLPTTGGRVSLENKGDGLVYANLVTRQQLLLDTLPAVSEGLRLEVAYLTDGKEININELQQGEEFDAWIKVTNTSVTKDYRDLALTHMVPSGWEIYNERLREAAAVDNEEQTESNLPIASSSVTNKKAYKYQDIRDDRVLTYFDLRQGQSIVINIRLQATYAGEYVLPAILCEAMYEPEIRARTAAGRVKVIR